MNQKGQSLTGLLTAWWVATAGEKAALPIQGNASRTPQLTIFPSPSLVMAPFLEQVATRGSGAERQDTRSRRLAIVRDWALRILRGGAALRAQDDVLGKIDGV